MNGGRRILGAIGIAAVSVAIALPFRRDAAPETLAESPRSDLKLQEQFVVAPLHVSGDAEASPAVGLDALAQESRRNSPASPGKIQQFPTLGNSALPELSPHYEPLRAPFEEEPILRSFASPDWLDAEKLFENLPSAGELNGLKNQPGSASAPVSPSTTKGRTEREEKDQENSPAEETPRSERTHLLRDGDTLERIAERYLGSPQRSGEIFEANRDVLTDPRILPLGVRLRLPLR